jgi:hypothetical protein
LEGLGMENGNILYDHLEYFLAISYKLGPFVIICGHLLHFPPFWYVWAKKNLASLLSTADLFFIFSESGT